MLGEQRISSVWTVSHTTHLHHWNWWVCRPGPTEENRAMSFPAAQQTGKRILNWPHFCLLAHLLSELLHAPVVPDCTQSCGQQTPAPHTASPMAACGTGSLTAPKVLSLNSLCWLWLSCCWFPFSSLPAELSQAGAVWGWEEAGSCENHWVTSWVRC